MRVLIPGCQAHRIRSENSQDELVVDLHSLHHLCLLPAEDFAVAAVECALIVTIRAHSLFPIMRKSEEVTDSKHDAGLAHARTDGPSPVHSNSRRAAIANMTD